MMGPSTTAAALGLVLVLCITLATAADMTGNRQVTQPQALCGRRRQLQAIVATPPPASPSAQPTPQKPAAGTATAKTAPTAAAGAGAATAKTPGTGAGAAAGAGAATAKPPGTTAAQVAKEVKTIAPEISQAAKAAEVVVYRTIVCNRCVLECKRKGGQTMGFKVCTNPLQVLQVCKCVIQVRAKQAAAAVSAAAVAAAKSAVPKQP